MLRTDNLSPMQLGRLNAALDRQYRYSDGVRTLRAELERAPVLEKSEGDGMIDWSRTRFNRMDGCQQREYEARLKAKRYYYLNGLQVPKIVYDAVPDEWSGQPDAADPDIDDATGERVNAHTGERQPAA